LVFKNPVSSADNGGVVRRLTLFLLFAVSSFAATVSQARTSTWVDERSCATPQAVSSFANTQRQVFFWFLLQQVRAGDQLKIEWQDPSGAIATSADYGELPNTSSVCIPSQLPLAGFAPASQLGTWTVRALVNGQTLVEKRFQITGERSTGGLEVTGVSWPGGNQPGVDFGVRGNGFTAGSVVNIAQYTRSGGWVYLASVPANTLSEHEIVAHYQGLPAAEYLAIVQTPDGRVSRPVPFTIASSHGYKLPLAAGEPWVLTQGPYGTFSHWGNSLQAFDIAPINSRLIVAMRGGIVHTFDTGQQQDHVHRTFGNYITIDHGDGEYSHYAHLQTGTFLVTNGQSVGQGQPLATAGNSGYTFGEGGGYHVHAHVTRSFSISAQSIPFEFEDLPGGARGALPKTVVSSNYPSSGPGLVNGTKVAALKTVKPQFQAAVAVEQWWNSLISVNSHTRELDVSLQWKDASANLDLHLVSPTGRHYAWYDDTTG
jgi:murein DD-endopeptidase MepM/ murein hydrolase activator NlpD